MKSYRYYQYMARARIADLEAHLKIYHDSIFDIPRYMVIFWYVLLYLIAPAPRPRLTKDAPDSEARP